MKAHSGREAVRLAAQQDFAAVLLDVQRPGQSGFETVRQFRAQDPSRQTPVIFLTAEEGPDFPTIEAYRLGAVDEPLSSCEGIHRSLAAAVGAGREAGDRFLHGVGSCEHFGRGSSYELPSSGPAKLTPV